MAKAKITKRSVDAATPLTKKYVVWDDSLTGFGLKVTPAGKKIYVFQYRLAEPGTAASTPPGLFTIGRHGSPWTPTTARNEAERVAILVRRDIDPRKELRDRIAAVEAEKQKAKEMARRASELSFASLSNRWLASLVPSGKSEKYFATCRWAIKTYLQPKLGTMVIDEITPEDIQCALDEIPEEKRATAVAVFDTAFALFKWCAGTRAGRVVKFNPLAVVDRPLKPEGRKRVLCDEELALVWKVAGELSEVWTAFYRLLIVTGKRRGEVSAMRWEELDRNSAEWLIPAHRTKNRNADLVSLPKPAIAILDGIALNGKASKSEDTEWPKHGFVMSENGAAPIGNHSKIKRQMDDAIEKASSGSIVEHWVIHDIRRTVATGMQRLGVSLEVIKAVLNHTVSSGATRDYLHHQWRKEKCEARELWAKHVEAVLTVSCANNVIALNHQKVRRMRAKG